MNSSVDPLGLSTEKVLQRGEKIELLVDKTEALSQSARKFQFQSKQLKNVMWCVFLAVGTKTHHHHRLRSTTLNNLMYAHSYDRRFKNVKLWALIAVIVLAIILAISMVRAACCRSINPQLPQKALIHCHLAVHAPAHAVCLRC